jgi:hypothetical protein
VYNETEIHNVSVSTEQCGIFVILKVRSEVRDVVSSFPATGRDPSFFIFYSFEYFSFFKTQQPLTHPHTHPHAQIHEKTT